MYDVMAREKYARQIIMPEIGEAGQEKLLNSSVLVIGAGGLGCPALQYLTGAGVGNIGIVDADIVSVTNLHRQILHPYENVGKNKAESAKEALERINPDVRIKTYPYRFTPDNAAEIISGYDFIIDAVDNFETKFLINDACVIAKKPFCHAGVILFNGQVMTYVPERGACMRCVFEEVPKKGSVPTCVQEGVMGAACGVIGCLEALEAIKHLTGAGDLLTGSMFTFDGLTMKARKVNFPKCSPTCRVCSSKADIKNVKDNAAAYI